MKKIFLVLLTFIIVGLTSNVAFANGGIANNVPFLNENGDVQVQSGVTRLVPPTPTNPLPNLLTSGWYVVEGDVTYADRIVIPTGNTVNLILANGAHLNATQGINVPQGATLTIFAQMVVGNGSQNIGELSARARSFGDAGIGGGDWEDGGDITINGGFLYVVGSRHGAGIGGGNQYAGGNITINDGVIIAIGGYQGAGIGGGCCGGGAVIQINGGSVFASGGASAAGIGGGAITGGGSITIDGGNIQAIGGTNGAGIGDGYMGGGTRIAINDGVITAIGGGLGVNGGAGIGGGAAGGSGTTITINGGSIEAIASSAGNAAAIGRGSNGADGTIIIGGTFDYITNTTANNPAATRQAGTETFTGTAVTHIPLSHGRDINTLKYINLEFVILDEPTPGGGGPLGSAPIGTVVYLRENGVLVPFIVVQQGRPAGLNANGSFNRPLRPTGNFFANNNSPVTAYANWGNATILMRERVLNPMPMGNAQNMRNVFWHTGIRTWLNNTYFNRLDLPMRNQVLNLTIPVVDCGTFHTLSTHGNQTQGIGSIAQRMFITNMNARVWIPHAAEIGIPWGTDNSNHTTVGHAFPNALSVLHWMPGAGNTWQQWNNTIRFAYFPFGHGTNPSRAVADSASEIRVARCDSGIARMWWTRCPGNQTSANAPSGVLVGTDGVGYMRSIRETAWIRPTMGFPNTLYLTAGNEVVITAP